MSTRPKVPRPLLLGFAAFLLVIGYLVAASLVSPRVAEFTPTPVGARPSGGPGPDTVTIDAADTERWRFYSFRRGVVSPPDTADWDLGFRRYHVIASGAVADLGPLTKAHPSSTGGAAAAGASFEGGAVAAAYIFMKTTFARDTVNPALAHWYRYGFVTHLLRPNGHVFVLRTRSGARARLEFLGYYCPGTKPGCPTFRWAWLTP